MWIKIKFEGRKDKVCAYIHRKGMTSEQEVAEHLSGMEEKIRAHAKKQIEAGYYITTPNDQNYYDLEKQVWDRKYHLGKLFQCGGIYHHIEEHYLYSEGWISYVFEHVDAGKYSPQTEFHVAHSYHFFLEGKCFHYISVTAEGERQSVTVYKDKKRKFERI